MQQIPRIDPLRRVQRIDGSKLRALVLNARIAPTDALESKRSVETQQIGERMPLEHAGIDLPLIAAQGKVRPFAIGVCQHAIELALPGTRELQFAGGLLVAQSLVGAQVGCDQKGAGTEQQKRQGSGPEKRARPHSSAPQATRSSEAGQNSRKGNEDDQCGECHGGNLDGNRNRTSWD